MTQTAYPDDSRVPLLGGTLLVLVGCCQFASAQLFVVIAIFVLHTFTLSYVHFSLSYNTVAAIYGVLGALFTTILLMRSRLLTADRSPASAPKAAVD